MPVKDRKKAVMSRTLSIILAVKEQRKLKTKDSEVPESSAQQTTIFRKGGIQLIQGSATSAVAQRAGSLGGKENLFISPG